MDSISSLFVGQRPSPARLDPKSHVRVDVRGATIHSYTLPIFKAFCRHRVRRIVLLRSVGIELSDWKGHLELVDTSRCRVDVLMAIRKTWESSAAELHFPTTRVQPTAARLVEESRGVQRLGQHLDFRSCAHIELHQRLCIKVPIPNAC